VIEIRRRIVKAKWHSTASTGVRELLDDIFAVGRVGYLVVGVGIIKHAEAIVVFRCENMYR
jgi:hypothetical protein